MATTSAPATTNDRDRDGNREAASGQAVTVQLAVQGWAITRPGPASPPADPGDPAA